MKSIKVEARIQKDGDEFYNMLKFLRRYEDKIINGSIKLKKKNVNEEINRFKYINDKYIFSNVKKKIKLKINGCIKIKKGTPERYYKQLVKKILHGNISINNKNINNILNYIEYIKYIKLCGNIRMIKKNRTDENENENEKVSPLLLKGHINKLRYLKKENDVKKERNKMSLRKSSYNIEKKEILDLTMKRYSHFGSERYNNYNLKNNSFYDNINVDHNKIRKTKVNKEKEKNININIHRTNGSINNKLNNKEFSFALYPSSGDKIRDVDEVQKKMNTFKLNIPSSIISKFNKTNKTNMLEERKSINYNLIKMRQEFMYEPRNNDKEKHNKIHLKGTINYIKSDNNNNKKKNNSNSNSNYYNNFHSIKFMFRGKKKKKIIKDKITDANYILCNEEKKKLLDLDRYNNEKNKSHETYVLSGNKIYDKIDNKNIFLDHSVFLNYNKKGQKRLSSSSSSKNKNINKSTYDETMLSMSDVDDIDYFMHIKEKNAIKYKDYMNKPKNKGQGNISIEEKKSVLKIKMTEGQENIKEKKNYINDTKCKINKKESNKYNNNNNMSNIKNKKFSSVSRKLSKPFSSSRSGAIFNLSNNKKENKNNKKKRRIKLNNGNRYMKKYVNKIMNMSILRRNFNNVNSSVFITHKKCFDKPKKDTRVNDKKCSNGVVETVDKKESINKLNVENNETQMMKKCNKNEDIGDNKDEDIDDNKNDDIEDNKNEDMNDNKNKDMNDNKNEDMDDNKNKDMDDNKNEDMNDNKNEDIDDNKNDNIINLSTDKNIKIGFYFEEACDIKQSNDKNISTTNETKKMGSPLKNNLLTKKMGSPPKNNLLTKKMGSPLMNNMLTKKMGSPLMNNILTKKQGMLKQFAITKENMDITKKEGVVLTMKKSVSIKKDADINISKDENVIEKNKVNFTIKSVQNILSKQLFKSKANPLIINKSNDSQIVATNKITVGVNVPVKSSLFKKDENEEKNNSNNIEEEEKKNVNMEKLILNEQEENYLNDKNINKAGLSKEDDVDIKEPVLTNTKEDIIKGEDQSISTNIVKEQHMKEEKINDNTMNDNTKNDNTKNDDTMNDKDKSDIINKKNSLESVKEEITEKEMLDEKDKMVPQLLECNSLQNKDENIKDMKIENCDDHMKDNITNKNNNMFIKKINIKMVPMLNKKAIPKSKTLPVLLKNKINILKEKFTTNKKLSNDSIDKTESCNIKMDEHKEEEKQNIESERKIIKPSKSIHKMINPGRHSFFNANKLLNSIEVKIGEHNSKMNEKEEPIKMLSNSVSIISDGKMDSLDKCGEEEKINDVKTDIDVNTHIDADVSVDVNINVEENINQSEKAKMVLKKGIPKLMMKFKAFPTKKMGIQNLENNKKVNSLRSIKDDKTLEEKNDTSEKGDDNIEKRDDTIEKKNDTSEKLDDTIEKKDDTSEKGEDTTEKTNEILNKQCEEEVKNEIDNTLQDKDDTQHILKTTKIILMKKIPPKYNKMNTVKMGDIKFPNNMNKFINKFHMVKNLSTLKEFPVKKLIKRDSNEENNSLEKIKVNEEKINDADMEKEADEDVIKVEEDLMNKKVNGETEIEMDKNVKDNMEKDDIQQDNMEKDNMEKDNMEKDNMEKDNMEKDNIEKDNIEKDNMEKDNMEKDNIEKDNMEKDNMEKNNIQQDNIQQDNSETSLNKNEEPNVVAESATIENEQVDKIIPRSFSKSLSIPMKIPTIKENMNKAKPTFWNKPKGKMFFLTKKEKSISQAKEILRSLEKSNN
ncbi:conserved Plasmodium protein, unknown function [Plasmodium sp. gorilla clade G2]|uniref:conserved Plasmodium protein, unknown function n=1 Tax=Plasmodium sp. gorilla clade G2 TaxID=880535 RepID=UPI000D226578|nr:conserved Plasmodium protein, unknown function [Plasmodium sp. gorilla clade G2]SOV15055.1 conserved Plasmodium protein, unknown function [Plasmodium sp. gorilla clade G2]